MDSNNILKSDLLDIIFENRNKDYGAYPLRKGYDTRLKTSFLIMLAFLFSMVLLSRLFPAKPLHILYNKIGTIDLLPGVMIEKPVKIKPVKQIVHANSTVLHNPVIMREIPIIKPIEMDQGGLNINGKPDGQELPALPGNGKSDSIQNTTASVRPVEKPNRDIPLKEAEVMPQFPGGLNALLKFLRQNLTSPEDIEEGDLKEVKVTFVVNYNGELSRFQVSKSGGLPFDNEVIRVLKKMPKWNPGRSGDENVSVYFSLPVKFTSSY